MVCTEMVSAKAISFHNKNTVALLETSPAEHPVSLQLFGADPDIISEMAAYIEERDFDVLDLNMGCPVPKLSLIHIFHRAREVFASEEGKALLAQWGIEGDYIGIGHCILGYRDCELPQAKPRKENYIYRV